MIQLPNPASLPAPERYALDLLVDLSRLVPVKRADIPILRLEVAREGAGETMRSVPEWIARGWGMEPGDGIVRIPSGALRAVTAIAGLEAEQSTRAADRYGRVPATANALVALHLERSPVVSRAGRALADCARRAAGRRPVRQLAPWPDHRRWALALTHDLDVVRWWPVFTVRRLAELLRRGEIGRALRVMEAAVVAGAGSPVVRALEAVIAAERSRRLVSTWFVLCGTPTVSTMAAGDLTYHPESALTRRLLAAMAAAGGEIGLHGSFVTYAAPDEFGRQRERLRQVTDREIAGVRQHFLRLRPGATQRAMAEQGFEYDASIGFPDRNGFRHGLADIAPVWDHGEGRTLSIDEVPVVWMDRALSKYRGTEDPGAWVTDGIALADEARAVEGLWVGVWHPNLAPALGFPGAPEAYGSLLDALIERAPYVGRMGELVAWRRARRRARVEWLGEDGVVRATADGIPAELDPA